MSQRSFPQYLNNQLQVLWFELDELILIFGFLLLGLMFSSLFFIAMFVVPYLFGKMKKKYPRGLLRHMLYTSGLDTFDGYPISFERYFNE